MIKQMCEPLLIAKSGHVELFVLQQLLFRLEIVSTYVTNIL